MEAKDIIIWVTILIIVAMVVAAGWIYFSWQNNYFVVMPEQNQGQNNQPTPQSQENSISDGTLKMSYDSAQFGLATNETQILVTSYIPPCDETFNYCFYYIGSAYAGTNFEAAGIRWQKRADLSAETSCLQTPPVGFSSSLKPDTTTTANAYSTSAFSAIGQGAAGHYTIGSLYRLFVKSNNACYEFETRMALAQFANYPAGTIGEFAPKDQTALRVQLQALLNTATLESGESISWPK